MMFKFIDLGNDTLVFIDDHLVTVIKDSYALTQAEIEQRAYDAFL